MGGSRPGVNENLRGIVLFGLAFLVFGLVMMAIRWFGNNDMAQLSATADDVLVVKVEPEEASGRRRRTEYRPYFKFRDANGNEVIAKSLFAYPDNIHPEGSRVSICYDPSDPQNRAALKGSVDNSGPIDFLAIVIAGFGALWTVVGFLVILVKHGIAKARSGDS